jgi:AGZA family xanthine/uracil permease-like MFS transporter
LKGWSAGIVWVFFRALSDDRQLHRALHPEDHAARGLLGTLAGVSVTFIAMRPALKCT